MRKIFAKRRIRKEHRLREALVKKTKYANLIDTYTSPDELEDKILLLKNLALVHML